MFVVIFGDIADIDYVGSTGPFASAAEANASAVELQNAGKLPSEEESEGELAWRVVELVSPDKLPSYY